MSSFFSGSDSGGSSNNDLDETCEMFTLSRETRLYGFGICFIVGFFFSLMGTLMLMAGNIISFAIMYSLGNIIALMSTAFLIGPFRQLKSMFDPIRLWATIAFLVALGGTVAFAFIAPLRGLCLLMLIVQFAAFTWYCASYIPYGRTLLKKCFAGICTFE